MRLTLALLVILCMPVIGRAQDNVRWTYSSNRINDKEVEVKITAELESPWHIYSQTSPEDAGLPTKFSFSKNPLLSLEGKVAEKGKLQSKYEDVFDATVTYYEGRVEFVQRIKMKAKVKTSLSGEIEYMLCDNEKCMPPATTRFVVAIN